MGWEGVKFNNVEFLLTSCTILILRENSIYTHVAEQRAVKLA